MRISLFVILFVLVSCKEEVKVSQIKNTISLSELDWMLGKWKREETGELELWSEKESSYFGGMVVQVNDANKAVIKEVLSLEGREDGIYYGAKVDGQNNGRKIDFKMSNENFEAPKFSNENHDFPKHISYMKIGNDKIKVELSGTDGEPVTFYYVRED
jgi:hypothetical protein